MTWTMRVPSIKKSRPFDSLPTFIILIKKLSRPKDTRCYRQFINDGTVNFKQRSLSMPIKEIIGFGMGIIMTLVITHGPQNLTRELRKLQIQILRETTNTDWGNPSIFQKKYLNHYKHIIHFSGDKPRKL